jgi:preprotein translocase subunit SecD
MALVTRNNLHRPLAIVTGREILSMPIIQSEIAGGRLQITLGRSLHPEEARLEAENLAMALRPSGRMSTRWVLAETR